MGGAYGKTLICNTLVVLIESVPWGVPWGEGALYITLPTFE